MGSKVFITNHRDMYSTFSNKTQFIYESLIHKVLSDTNSIQKTIIIPYKENGDVIFDLVSYSDGIYLYKFTTTVS